jgi:ribosome assembly protein RRB1
MMDDEEDEKMTNTQQCVWKPSDGIEEGVELDYDASTYTSFHRLRSDWPCLSFDILCDGLGNGRVKYPHTMYMVAGTQADSADNNVIKVFKVSDLHKTKHDDESDPEDSDPDDLDDDPILDERTISHPGAINRIRSMPQQSHIISTWAETGQVHVWNALADIQSLDAPQRLNPQRPLYSFTHNTEGFAMDWSKRVAGLMATGDMNAHIHIWEPTQSSWQVSAAVPGHASSIEDIQWSPTEPTVFASCSSDGHINIYDTRERKRAMLSVRAHDTDVNVISWNSKASHLLLSGADDGTVKVWDLNTFSANSPAAHFQWHGAPITSVEWHPTDDSVFAASCADDSISFWDMGLELDDDLPAEGATLGVPDVPSQLLFIHRGQSQIKEIHWHHQIPGMLVSTAADGFNFLQPDNLRALEEEHFEGKFREGYDASAQQ